MAIRIAEPALDDTRQLLVQVLGHVQAGSRVAFLVDAGKGRDVVARLRTMISRQRGRLVAHGRRPKRFTLHSSIHPETHQGKRHDCIVLWKTVGDSHMLTETLEDILAKDAVNG